MGLPDFSNSGKNCEVRVQVFDTQIFAGSLNFSLPLGREFIKKQKNKKNKKNKKKQRPYGKHSNKSWRFSTK